MAETILEGCTGGPKWHWYSVQRDLEEQAGLKGVFINPLGASTYGDISFVVTWEHNKYMLISMSEYSQELVNAFAKVVEYQPFCRYINEYGLVTVEWDKVDPEGQVASLEQNGKAKDLVRLGTCEQTLKRGELYHGS